MKTLIATMAVLFTMATAASAFDTEELNNCLNVAAVKAVSIDYGLTVYELNLHMHNPKYVEDAAAVYEMTHKVTMDTIRGKANNVPMIEVVNSIEEDSDTFMVLASACIGNYYISYQN